MIAYNKEKLKKLLILKEIDELYEKKLLTEEQYQESRIKYNSGLYTPDIYKKIWVFIYVAFAVFVFTCLIVHMFSVINKSYNSVGYLFCSVVCFGILEYTIKVSNHYKSGRHEAFLYLGLFLLLSIVVKISGGIYGNNHNKLIFSLIYLPILIAATIRYSDRLVAFFLNLCFYTVYSLLILDIGVNALLILPYAMMLIATIIYFGSIQLKKKEAFLFWKDCLSIFEVIALIVFYAAGNYCMIKSASIMFIDIHFIKGEIVPSPIVFISFTALVPLGYVYFGLKNKNKPLLWVGLSFILPSMLSIEFYYKLHRPYISLIVLGIIMITIATFCIKYLNTPKYGISSKKGDAEEELLIEN